MKKFRSLSEELTPSSKPEPGREAVGGRFQSSAAKRPMKPAPIVTSEEKDEEEYGYEGDMAMNQLRTIIRHSEYLMDMMKPDTDLPEWVQSKITLAADYIQTSCDYMTSEMNEAKEVGDIPSGDVSPSNLTVKKGKTVAAGPVTEATSAAVRMQRALDKIKQSREASERRAQELLKPKQPTQPTQKEEVEHLEEGRPSQRHPLEGHEYHKKSDEALIHIAKDAHAAAEAMKGHNTTAENKYRDQANDSATVRHFRKTSGMPDWYKKKYGHMKEDAGCNQSKAGVECSVHGMKDCTPGQMKETFRPMDEPNMNLSIQARQKKADDNKPPFDGPYKKTTSVVTDKSGAKHTGMSTAKHLARQALKKQASKMSVKESLEESRKAEIVKEIIKKGKKSEENKFQAEPELGTTVVKADN